MKKIDLGQTLGILANVGVIAGIVFLAFELRQNNELLVAQTTYSQFAIDREQRIAIMQTDGLLEAMVKARNDSPLSEIEDLRLQFLYNDMVDTWRWQSREVQAGRLPNDFIDVNSWRGAMDRLPGVREAFEDDRPILDPEFVQFVDENVINR